VTERGNFQMHGETAIPVTVFRIKDVEKGKTVIHRERTVNTWAKINGA
jgi:hypothetical protein